MISGGDEVGVDFVFLPGLNRVVASGVVAEPEEELALVFQVPGDFSFQIVVVLFRLEFKKGFF